MLISLIAISLLGCFRGVAGGLWPSPETLWAFWPLDATSGFQDIANGRNITNPYRGVVMTSINGPFGVPNSSYAVSCDSCYIGERYPQNDAPLQETFTVSFYFYTAATQRGGIWMLAYGSSYVFGIGYNTPNVLELNGPSYSTLIGSFPILIANSWNFFAITYENRRIRIYNNEGLVLASANATLTARNDHQVYFGYRYSGNYMYKSDALACVMYYTSALTPSQISTLPKVCQTKISIKSNTLWPRPESLLSLWPLSSNHQTGGRFNDVGPKSLHATTYSNAALTVGPFGNSNSAISKKSQNSYLIEVANSNAKITSSFTIAMFLQRQNQSMGPGGIFEFRDQFGSENAFQLRYINDTTIEVAANNVSIGRYEIVQQNGAWFFVAFTFDAPSFMFTVYTKHGQFAKPTLNPYVWSANTFNNQGIRLGYATKWRQHMPTTDAVSCLAIYQEALTWSELRKLQRACRTLLDAQPCGSPKLPLTPIPNSVSITTPKPGQFPYHASIRSGPVQCSATILDAYWLLTSSQCFVETSNPSLFKVTVGEHDLNITESYQQSHNVSKIYISSLQQQKAQQAREIALVQLETPIDFTSDYVNDVCLVDLDDLAELAPQETQFAVGWGKNGRSSLTSPTLPRYIPGLALPESYCQAAWGNETYKPLADVCFSPHVADKTVPCTGDEGSPLLVQAPAIPELGIGQRLVQVGTYYKRDTNCSPAKPGLFTDLLLYTEWISQKLACSVPGVSDPTTCPLQI